jgi:DNA protecting protein DprA
MLMTPARQGEPSRRSGGGYTAPPSVKTAWLRDMLHSAGRGSLTARQLDIFKSVEPDGAEDAKLYYAGDVDLVSRPCVSIVGTREASHEGRARASRLARELVQHGAVIVSGLARGIDAAAQMSAIDNGGRTVAVIGTPLSKASPAENSALQEKIWREHLLISPFPEGRPVYRSNFPQRNRVMAAITDATVIVEASDTSGTLHQAAECQTLGRWLFILRTAVDNPAASWPKRFLNAPKTVILDRTEQIIDAISTK